MQDNMLTVDATAIATAAATATTISVEERQVPDLRPHLPPLIKVLEDADAEARAALSLLTARRTRVLR